MLNGYGKSSCRFRCKLVASALLLASAPASAQEPTPASPTDSPKPPKVVETTSRNAAKKTAEELYQRGRAFFKKGQWASALLQFEAAFRAFPTWGARTNMGTCLVKLQRYDEALDVFESALRDFGDVLPAKSKASALGQVNIIRRETGALMITGAAPGALIFVGGRLRGENPLAAPVPMLVGAHWIRVYKEGFVVYEQEVTIPKGGMQTVDVKLTALLNTGRLKVGEVAGRKMEVVVDGIPVGVTPWEGEVSPGPHSIALRPVTAKNDPRKGVCDPEETAFIPEDAADPTSAEMGTEPMTVIVKEGQTTPIDLKAERLGAVVRIVPNPPDADVYIDGVWVGRGLYIGRAKPGKHIVKTKADGYFAKAEEIDAKSDDETSPPLRLEKDVNAPKWATAGRFLLEVRAGVPLAPSLGGDLDALCTDFCQQGLGAGVNATFRAGYEFPNGFGLGGTIGYLRLSQSHVGFNATLVIDEGLNGNVDLKDHQGRANDATLFQNFMVGAYGSYKLGNRFPIRLGLGAGFMYGNVTYSRTGTFDNQAVGPLEQSGFFPWIYIEPEARIGVRISEGWSLGVAISSLVLVAPKIPVWTQDMQVNAHGDNPDQLGKFKPEKITGGAFFSMNQGIYVQYGF